MINIQFRILRGTVHTYGKSPKVHPKVSFLLNCKRFQIDANREENNRFLDVDNFKRLPQIGNETMSYRIGITDVQS